MLSALPLIVSDRQMDRLRALPDSPLPLQMGLLWKLLHNVLLAPIQIIVVFFYFCHNTDGSFMPIWDSQILLCPEEKMVPPANQSMNDTKCWDIPTPTAHTLLTYFILGQFYYWGVLGVFIIHPCLPMMDHKWFMLFHDAWEWQHQSKGLFYWGGKLVSYSSNLSSLTGLVHDLDRSALFLCLVWPRHVPLYPAAQ